ncbi:hypothetical protein [Duffyella gerundensis]|uniref:hypothetical protein n=1 Tax=Duffyella gerundensis TaxID=1619313 RepID=UPI003FD619A3
MSIGIPDPDIKRKHALITQDEILPFRNDDIQLFVKVVVLAHISGRVRKYEHIHFITKAIAAQINDSIVTFEGYF